MLKRHISTLILFPLVLGGCSAVGPDFKEPPVNSPEKWRVDVPMDAPSAANLPWWEVFKDEDLQRLIRTGLEQNREIRAALARIEQGRAALGVSNAAFLPSVGYNGTALHGDPKTTQLAGPHGYMLGGSVQWEVDLWGRVRRLNESARAQYFASNENKNAVVLALVAEIAVGYFNLRMLDAQVAIAEQTAWTREAAWKLAKDRLEKDVGNAIDALQFEADMIAAQTSVVSLKNAIVVQENALSLLLGELPKSVARKAVAESNAALPPIPAGLPSDILLNRPDLRAAVQNVHAANAQIGAAVANYFPKISLTGVLGFVHPQLGHLLEGGNRQSQAGGSLLGPIFDGGTTYYSVKAAEARTREAVLNYEQTALNAFREVNDALSSLRAARERVALLRREAGVLTSALEKTRRAYEAGKVALLPVLDADRNLFSVKLTLAEAQATELTAGVRLYKALGGGWRTNDLKKPLVASDGQIAGAPNSTENKGK
ncbi:MAG: efflux transporter outer membrane subunit [Puniceicoccales bacterium]|jgi:multidrug efflux system outer membrane protein|nr:efflux transporter outer membrane subunit [Puniceicoccales bacterium]